MRTIFDRAARRMRGRILTVTPFIPSDAGVVILAGEKLADLSPGRRRALRARAAGFVFQRSNLLAGLTVRENVLLAAALARERGVTVLVARHDLRLREFATRRLWISDGELRPDRLPSSG